MNCSRAAEQLVFIKGQEGLRKSSELSWMPVVPWAAFVSA